MKKNYELLFKDAFNNNADLIEFAIAFSEGDNLLEETLLNLWNSNIKTFACCKGHDTPKYYIPSYLAIEIDQYSIGLIESIYDTLNQKKDISFTIGNINGDSLDSFAIYMRGDTKGDTLNLINQYVNKKISKKNKIISDSLYLLEIAKALSLKFEIEICKDNVYIILRKQTDSTTYIDFRPLDECITSLYNINNISHLFVKCNTGDLDKIIDILKQNN